MIRILDPQYGDNFVGRGAEINEFKEKIENNGIVVVTGDRGIGKTNLIKVVERDIEKQKECHYIDDGLLFSDEISRFFLPNKLITGTSGSVSILGFGGGGGTSWNLREPSVFEYMEKSGERLIFVENAHKLKEEEIATIFAATRRNDSLRFVLEIATPYKPEDKLEMDSYEVVKLKELSNEDIEKIVQKECPNFSDLIVKRIISLSKGYPYVARSLAYICDRKNAEEEMSEFLETLRDDDMSYNINKIHNEVLETLNQDSQEVIKKLAIAPATLTLKLIQAFCGEEVDTPLNDIIERGILVASGEKFYQIYHPLFREYLRDKQRIAFKNKKEIYCRAIEKVKSEFDSFFMLLEVFYELDIFKELIKRTENYEVINSIGSQACTWGELEQALYAWKHLLERTKDKDKEWESIARGNIGIVYQIKGELDKALEYYGKAFKLNEELRNKEGMTAAFGNMGNVYLTKGELNKALEYFEKALELNEELGSEGGMAVDFGNMGNVYLTKGELDKALEYFKKALRLDEEFGRKEGKANQLGNIGIVYGKKGEFDKALEYFENALGLEEELGRKGGKANQLGNIGIVYQGKGELDTALVYFEKALEIFKDMSIRIETAKTLMNIGDVFTLKSDEERALKYYLEAQDLAIGSSVFGDISKRINNIRSK
jgi:tetratricopeptide (TPR) repeat protein